MQRTFTCLLVFVGAAALAGCATPGGPVPYSPAGFGEPDTTLAPISQGLETIVPADKLQVTVFQEPDVSGEFIVDHAGRIDFPVLGQLEVKGMTAPQLAELIKTRLSQTYLRDPKVQVAITEAAQRTVTVEGAVAESGIFPITGPTTLIRAVALAKGTTRDANDARVVVFRTIDGQRMAAAFDLTAIRRAEAPDPEIYGNDVIVVPGSKSRSIFRDVISTIPILGIFRPF